jgi:hypothetical protein
VISGFLITGLLWREVRDTGRRAARPVLRGSRPAAAAGGVVVLVATRGGGAAWLLPPLQARGRAGRRRRQRALRRQLPARRPGHRLPGADAALAVPALLVAGRGGAVLPALAGAADPHRRGWRAPAAPRTGRRPRSSLVLGLVAAGSFAVSLWTATLAAVGVLLAALPGLGAGRRRAGRRPHAPAGGAACRAAGRARRLAGLALVVVGCVRLDESTAVPGDGGAAAGARHGAGRRGGCAGHRGGVPARLSGRRRCGRSGGWSYSWYLWHWPVLLLAPPLLGTPLGLPARLAPPAVSGCWPCHPAAGREPGPLRRAAAPVAGRSLLLGGPDGRRGSRPRLVLLTVVPVPVGTGAAAAGTDDRGGRRGPAPRRWIRRRRLCGTSPPRSSRRRGLGGASRRCPSNLTPVRWPMRRGRSRLCSSTAACGPGRRYVGQASARPAPPRRPRTVALVGDSHAAMWQPALEQLATQRHWRLETMGKVTCPLLDLPITSPYLGREYTECEQWRGQMLDRLRRRASRARRRGTAHHYGPDFGFTAYSQQWLDSLTARSPRCGPPAARSWCWARSRIRTGTCRPASPATSTRRRAHPRPGRGVDDAGIAAEAAATEAGGGHYAELTDLFCTADRVPGGRGQPAGLPGRQPPHDRVRAVPRAGPGRGCPQIGW